MDYVEKYILCLSSAFVADTSFKTLGYFAVGGHLAEHYLIPRQCSQIVAGRNGQQCTQRFRYTNGPEYWRSDCRILQQPKHPSNMILCLVLAYLRMQWSLFPFSSLPSTNC